MKIFVYSYANAIEHSPFKLFSFKYDEDVIRLSFVIPFFFLSKR